MALEFSEREKDIIVHGLQLFMSNAAQYEGIVTEPERKELFRGGYEDAKALIRKVTHGVDSPGAVLTEGEIGGIACDLFKRLGGTDVEWVNKPRLRDTWTREVAATIRGVQTTGGSDAKT